MFSDNNIIKEELERIFEVLGVQSIKFVSVRDKVSYGKRNLNEIYSVMKTKVAEVLVEKAEKLVSDELLILTVRKARIWVRL